jgi:hypothetical protein
VVALDGAVAHTSAAGAAGTTATTAALRICSGCAQSGGNLSQYRYVILNSWDAAMIPALKAANPGLKALVYKNLSFTVDYTCSNGVDNAYLTAGIGYCDANSNHPDWFLQDTSGRRINSSAFTSAWMMDVGNSAYQNRWTSNVAADLKAHGWDGVFVDDTDADMSYHLGGRTIARYPSTAAWQSATRSMLANVGPALTSQGFLVIPNLYAPWLSTYDAPALWKDWIQFTSGAAQEYYTKWGLTSSSWFTGNDWTWRQQFQIITEAAGKIFLGITYAPHSDTRSMLYARGNFLLNDSGGASALVFEPSDPEASDPYSTSWTVDIGSPVGARYQVGAAWRRDFSAGTVIVNPSASAVTVPLDKAYVDPATGAAVSSVTLQSATAAILRTTSTPAPPLTTTSTPTTTTTTTSTTTSTTTTTTSTSSATAASPTVSPRITLTAVRSGGRVKLRWSGATSSRVDVLRNTLRTTTTANDGAYDDRPPRRATLFYQVCATGTSTCSDTVYVTTPTLRALASSNGERLRHRLSPPL